jgi:hypothetical protein
MPGDGLDRRWVEGVGSQGVLDGGAAVEEAVRAGGSEQCGDGRVGACYAQGDGVALAPFVGFLEQAQADDAGEVHGGEVHDHHAGRAFHFGAGGRQGAFQDVGGEQVDLAGGANDNGGPTVIVVDGEKIVGRRSGEGPHVLLRAARPGSPRRAGPARRPSIEAWSTSTGKAARC